MRLLFTVASLCVGIFFVFRIGRKNEKGLMKVVFRTMVCERMVSGDVELVRFFAFLKVGVF